MYAHVNTHCIDAWHIDAPKINPEISHMKQLFDKSTTQIETEKMMKIWYQQCLHL